MSNPPQPVCKFEQGCHRVVPCDPGCGAAAALSVPPPATRADDRAALLREAADKVFALDYDVMVGEEGDENLGSMREAWDLGTIHATELLRRLAAEALTDDAAPAALDLVAGPVRCPLCVHTVTLHTPNGARAHFTTVHPEQRITGRGAGPWPLLVTDGAEAPTTTKPDSGEEFDYPRDPDAELIVNSLPPEVQRRIRAQLAADARQDGTQS